MSSRELKLIFGVFLETKQINHFWVLVARNILFSTPWEGIPLPQPPRAQCAFMLSSLALCPPPTFKVAPKPMPTRGRMLITEFCTA